MASNYSQFSEAIHLRSADEIAWCRRRLAELETGEDGLGFAWEIDAENDLWLHDDGGSGDIGQVADLVGEYLAKFDPDGCFTLTYAETCSAPRIGEFGGGAAFVTARRTTYLSAHDWARKHAEAWRAGKRRTARRRHRA